MKNKNTFKLVLSVLVVFFALQLLSHLFQYLGDKKTVGKKSEWYKRSALLMPLEAEPAYRYAYAMLFENAETQDDEAFLKSIHVFELSLQHNVLLYKAHYYLGKALFLYNQPNSPYFDRAVRAFKRAALIRGNKNNDIALDTLKLLLTQWPLLNEEGKTFCREVLEKSIAQLSGKEFNSILEAWRLYSQDIDLFKGILKTHPEYSLNIARELSLMEVNLEMRQDFLARYEVHYLDRLKSMARKYREDTTNLAAQLKYLYGISHIEGYYRLVKSADFSEKDYLEFKKTLVLDILRLLLDQGEWKTDTQKKKEIKQYIFDYIGTSPSRKEMESFSELLKKYNYFDTQDLKVFYIKQLIALKLGNYSQVIDETERFQQDLAFVQKEQMNDYIEILLLLSDVFYEDKLMARALSVLEEIEKIAPGLPETYWRMMKIESIIGPDDGSAGEGKEDEGRAEQYRAVKESRFIESVGYETRKIVYLVDSGEIVIRISEPLKEMMKTRHLFQVYIDGKIYYEAYISRIEGDRVTVRLGEEAARCEVLVKIG